MTHFAPLASASRCARRVAALGAATFLALSSPSCSGDGAPPDVTPPADRFTLPLCDQPVGEQAPLAFRGARESTAQLLDRMTDEDWRRHGWHSEAGAFHAELWLEWYSAHAHNHADQIRRLREALGA